MKILKILAVVVFILCATAFGLYKYGEQCVNVVPQQKIYTENEVIEVKPGETPYEVIHKMVKEPTHDLWYRIWFHQHPEMTKIKYGFYSLSGIYTLGDLLEKLTKGKQISLNFTIVPGTRTDRIFENLSKATLMNHTLEDVNNLEKLSSEFKYSEKSLEGLFLPDSYAYEPNTPDTQILKRSNQSLMKYLDEEWENRAKDLPYENQYEALIMASIIEKETAVADEYFLVSAVFVNRLKKGMKLQTDPTVIYGVRDHFSGKITKADLKDENEYNTYVINGLPPTPIAIASRETIHAALHPADVDYLFFVANGLGGHKFSSTLKEHNKAVKEYVKLLKENKAISHKQQVKDQIVDTAEDLGVSLSEKAEEVESALLSFYEKISDTNSGKSEVQKPDVKEDQNK